MLEEHFGRDVSSQRMYQLVKLPPATCYVQCVPSFSGTLKAAFNQKINATQVEQGIRHAAAAAGTQYSQVSHLSHPGSRETRESKLN